MTWLVFAPAFAIASAAGAMLSGGLTVSEYVLLADALAESVTFTVNEHVPAVGGVPDKTTVPASTLAVRLEAVRPVVPALKPLTNKVVYGVVPLLTVMF